MPTERVTFPGSLSHPLVGRLDLPENAEPRGFVLWAACFTCVKDLKAARWAGRRLVERGYGVLRFDYSGLGESGGTFADATFESHVGDIVAAAHHLATHQSPPVALVGHSLGGFAACAAITQLRAPRLLATLNSPFDTQHLAALIRTRAPQVERGDVEPMSFAGGRPVPVGRPLLESFSNVDSRAILHAVDRPTIVFQSTDDDILTRGAADRLYQGLNCVKSFVTLPGADHLLTRDESHSRFVANLVADWLETFA